MGGVAVRHGCLAALMTIILGATSSEVAPPPFYTLLPFDHRGPLIRVCHTEYGICAIPFTIQPGAPCECVTTSGTWVPGVTVH
jgi:hypothetical protein